MNNRTHEFVAVYNRNILTPIIGKIIQKQNNYTVVVEHWLPNRQLSLLDKPVIEKCNGIGCFYKEPIGSINDVACAARYAVTDVVKIDRKSLLRVDNTKKYTLYTSIYEILQTAEFHYKFLYSFYHYSISSPIIQVSNLDLI